MSYTGSPTFLRCDRPDCGEHVALLGPLTDERAHRRALTARAELQGWQLSPHGDVPIDFCARHTDLTRPHKLTALYDAQGRALPYRGGR
jgi:hypothetical protein